MTRSVALLCIAAGLALLPQALEAGFALAAKVKPDLKTPPVGTRVDVIADRITYDSRSKVATATGRVEIIYGRYVLVATRVTYDQARDIMTANGEVRLKEPGGNILEAETAQLRNRFRDGFARHLRLLLTNEATVTAQYATRSNGYLTVYERVTYTRCNSCVLADGTPAWQLKSRQVTHDERKGIVYHKDATLQIGGVDLITLPYLSHPDPSVKRMSGFLVPSFSYADAYGFGVEVPYFWNLAPNYDITFMPVFTTDQGVLAHAEWRHRLAHGRYNIDAAGIYQLDDNEPPPGDTRWRGSIRTEGEFDIAPGWVWGWDGTLVSDKTFMRRYKLDDRDEAINQVYVTGIRGRNYFSAKAMQFQTLLTSEDQDTLPTALPYIRDSRYFDQPVLGGEFGIDSSIYNLDRNDPLSPFPTVRQGTHQTRAVSDIHWQRQTIDGMGHVVTPFARLRSDFYLTENLPEAGDPEELRDSDTTERILPTLGVDARWPFINSGDAGQQHVLAPVAQIIASGNETDLDEIGNEDAISLNFDHTSLFLQDRFSGLDRYEGGTRANLGLLYTFLAPTGGFLRVSGGESFHIAGENSFTTDSGLEDTQSDLVAAIALQPNDLMRFTYQVRVDNDLSDIASQEVGTSLTFDRISGSLNYASLDAEPAYGRPRSEEQVWGNAAYNFTGGWSAFGGLRYDLRDSELLKTTAGIAYDCDCMNLRLAYSEDKTDRDGDANGGSSILLTVELKTLGSAGVSSGL